MKKEVIASKSYPQKHRTYMCSAVKAGDFIFLSDVTARDPKTLKIVEGGIEAQTRQAFSNVEAVLKDAGSSIDKIVKTIVFLRNRDDTPKYMEVREAFFKGHPPCASSGVMGVDLYDPAALIELDVTATV